MKMFKEVFVVASMVVMVACGAVQAQVPSRLQQFDAWGVYSYKSSGNTICYVLSMPLSELPTTVKHGDNFFLVTKHSNSPVLFEPQFLAGYTLKEGSKVTVIIGDEDFEFFTKDSSAWLSSPKLEQRFVSAMRSGMHMTVKAISKRETYTTYTYSLKGVTAALNAAQKCH
ncbi:invasion associated locus B family protein [Bartonella sp. A05]|uniref:invasion associated locus B family protein n=1 Tax=Bartonella sp. A05 TaxID=2967261 RepID=UPI0022A9BDFB|nr:invasion associated locus B family protein [Bartonella sp. A05]MCZ2203499.1 invasion associated locus B family protein [Bartonella sp. A05]